jgi:DNA-binding transcriptional ArsR family regulator
MTAESRPGSPGAATIDSRVVKALGHPTRIRILNLLGERELVSPVELAGELGLALGTVGYHVRQLEALGFIELAKRTQRRGAVEHHYRARATLDPAPPAGRGGRGTIGAVAGRAVAACGAAQEALGRGGFDAVQARCDLRILTLDAPGRSALAELARGWSATIVRIERRAARRLAARKATVRACTAVTMTFEVGPEAD